MLDKKIRILNFDNSVIKQKSLFSNYPVEIIDLTDIGPKARYFMGPGTRNLIAKRLEGSEKNSITLLGSGDFHHISEMLISGFSEPLSVISFDNHPDWDLLPPRFGCGSWVSEVLKKNNILKVVLAGISSDDISDFNIETRNLATLKDDRVEIYPYVHKPTKVFLRRIPPNISLKIEKRFFFRKILWDEFKDQDPEAFFGKILARMPTKKVYVSIDKDCMKIDHALTNWEEGRVPLEKLLAILALIRKNMDIAGLDITGEYSPVLVKGMLKTIASYLDHPRCAKAQDMEEKAVTAVNEETNLKILDIIMA